MNIKMIKETTNLKSKNSQFEKEIQNLRHQFETAQLKAKNAKEAKTSLSLSVTEKSNSIKKLTRENENLADQNRGFDNQVKSLKEKVVLFEK